MKALPSLSLLLKPASSLCSLRCRYCFYADEAARRSRPSSGFMSHETARRLIDAAFDAVTDRAQVTFAFQGGEPTLAGLDFFESFCAAAEELNRKNLRLSFSLQTNGLLIDPSWADFLRRRHFLVGVSLDGSAPLHDAFRQDPEGNGTFARAAAAVKLLRKSSVDVNLLTVVTGRAAAQPRRVYQSLKAFGIRYLQFIPCLDPLDAPPGRSEWSLNPVDYGSFLCSVFDLWAQDWAAGRYVSIRQFEDWVRLAAGLTPDMCASCGLCGSYLVAEADGSLYPCDFYVLDEWCLGSVREGLLPSLSSDRMKAFRRRGLEKPAACRSCPLFSLCRGGCPRNWQSPEGRIENTLCPAFRVFFPYALPRLREMARSLVP